MDENGFFNKIDFNKPWNESDWEKFFQAQDAYRMSFRTNEVRKKPMSKIKFHGTDEVAAFEPVMREYSSGSSPTIVQQLRAVPFYGDGNPEVDYHPATTEDPHYWGEGAPLATVLIYRDSCRFAICTSLELDKLLKRRKLSFRRRHSAEFEALRFHANWVAINVGEGHQLGYSEDRIYGNVAKVRRAIKHAELCIALINRVSHKTRSMRLRRELFAFAVQLRNALYDWVEELKIRVVEEL